MKPLNEIQVSLQFDHAPIRVGRLALSDRKIYFEYASDFISRGLSLSPFKLPLERGVKTFNPFLFDGLPGVFNDSLPDGWGKLLLDRLLRGNGILPEEFSPLDRLAHIGRSGLGALIYEPDHSEVSHSGTILLDELARQTEEVLSGAARDVLEELIDLNGSSAGARPKALIGVVESHQEIIHGRQGLPEGFAHWLVKFPNSGDGLDAGAIEYVYALMARKAGINLTECHLFSAANGPGYFATRRFDRIGNQRLHMHTASGLLHADFRTPSLDYEDLLTLTGALTRDIREVKKMYRLAVFNVLSHNRDDHGKNFSFLMDANGDWVLSPAYDLTFSSGPRGHQSTMVLGEGQHPEIKDLKKLGALIELKPAEIREVIEQTCEALNQWEVLAKNHGVSTANIRLIGSRISR